MKNSELRFSLGGRTSCSVVLKYRVLISYLILFLARTMAFAFLVCLLLSITETTEVPAYRVTISSSHQSPIAYDVGNVQLNCSVTPLPDSPVEYRWTVVPAGYFARDPSPSQSSLPNTTVNFKPYETVRHPTYYCHVYANGSKVATGSIRFTVQGSCCYIACRLLEFHDVRVC